jgi:hypothetical protein
MAVVWDEPDRSGNARPQGGDRKFAAYPGTLTLDPEALS